MGHEVHVLTSTYGVDRPGSEGHVHRYLELDPAHKPGILRRIAQILVKEMTNRAACSRWVRELCPDLIYVWNLGGSSLSILRTSQRHGKPVVVSIADYWMASWQKDAWLNLQKKLGVRPQCVKWLPVSGIQYISAYMKTAMKNAIPELPDGDVIHWGIDETLFKFRRDPRVPKKLLYVGQVVRHKGVHTAIDAFKELAFDPECKGLSLTIAGGSLEPQYETWLKGVVHEAGLSDRVYFTGPKAQTELAALYLEHDIFIFPSVWDEPFGMTYLEAMASGMVVVGTAAGGSAEVMRSEVNSLVFERENGSDCARQIKRLLQNPRLLETLRSQGRQDVERTFNVDQMVARSEQFLLSFQSQRFNKEQAN
jgi:glycosyltransferase involved in cell wall biosynthesis